jgi:hypothetical protein
MAEAANVAVDGKTKAQCLAARSPSPRRVAFAALPAGCEGALLLAAVVSMCLCVGGGHGVVCQLHSRHVLAMVVGKRAQIIVRLAVA